MIRRRELLLTAAAAPAFLRSQSRSRPNILFLMADQHRFDCLGSAGNAAIHTPNLDRLSQEGVRFANAYSCTPTCTPARAALLTGLGPWRNGLLGYGNVGRQYRTEMPRLLREAGYFTMGIGKMHWHPQRNMHGFDRVLLDESGRIESPDFRSDYRAWFASVAPNLDPDATGIGWNDRSTAAYALSEELHPTRWTGDCAVRFLDTYGGSKPFFLKVSFARPHSPYDPPNRWLHRYWNATVPAAPVGGWAQRYAKRNTEADDLWHGNVGASIVRGSRQGYYGSVSFVDEQIGRVLASLEKRGWLEETLVVYCSDHGDMLGDQHLWRKSYGYEGSAHIPLLMRLPGREAAGMVRKEPVELRDILPTFLGAAGVQSPEPLDGADLAGLVRGKTAWRKFIDLEHDVCYSPENHWNGLTDGAWKYLYDAKDGSEQLFDLTRDPYEERDLSGEASATATLREWRGRLTGHLAARGERWVKGGSLVPRPESQLYSPNYPG